MLLNKYDVHNIYLFIIYYLINCSSSGQFLPILRGGGHQQWVFFYIYIYNLKLIFFQGNIEGFKKICNSITLL